MSAKWQTQLLADICSKITDGSHYSPKAVESGKPMVSVKDLTRFGIDLSDVKKISCSDFEDLVRSGCKPEVGDVLIAKDGNSALDTVCTVDEPLDIVLLSSVAILRPDRKVLDSDYLKYYFNSKSVIAYMKANFITGAAIPRVVLSDFRKAEITVPPLDIQKRIASVLRSLDDKILINMKLNETLSSISRLIFVNWFVDFDPVRIKSRILQNGGTNYDAEHAVMSAISGMDESVIEVMKNKNSDWYLKLAQIVSLFPSCMITTEWGAIPSGWSVRPLDQIANYQNGLALQKYRPDDESDFLPVLKIAQLKKGIADSGEKASPNIRPECIVNNGDVIFSWSGSLMVDTWCGGKVALNQHLFKVTSDKYPKWLYYHYTKHHLEEFQRIAAAKAVTMGHIKREHLSGALCVVPSNNLICLCDEVLGSILDMQIKLRIENTVLADIRDTLLPKLISGEIDLSKINDIEAKI